MNIEVHKVCHTSRVCVRQSVHGCGRTPSPADGVGASPVLTATDGGSQHLRAGRRIRGGVAW